MSLRHIIEILPFLYKQSDQQVGLPKVAQSQESSAEEIVEDAVQTIDSRKS
jgi:hypothetical protein